MVVAFRPNTQLGDATQPWEVDVVVDRFLASPYFHPGGDTRRQLQFFVTDQDGPIRGVCTEADLATLTTAVRRRTDALVTTGKDPA